MKNIKKLINVQSLFLLLFVFSIFSLSAKKEVKFKYPEERPKKNDSEIIKAVKMRDLVKLSELIEDGVDLEERCKQSGTPLVWAFYFMWLDGVEKLIDAGADIHIYTYYDAASINLWHVLMLSPYRDVDFESVQNSLKLIDLLKEYNVKIISFDFEALDLLERYKKKNPKLIKSFFKEVRFKKGFWWMYRLIYKPFIDITDAIAEHEMKIKLRNEKAGDKIIDSDEVLLIFGSALFVLVFPELVKLIKEQ